MELITRAVTVFGAEKQIEWRWNTSGPRTLICAECSQGGMQLILDNLVRESVERACEEAHLRRTDVSLDRDVLLIEILRKSEAGGDAMRHVSSSQMSWKATPKLRQHLKDLELDAHGDLEDI